jgi:hypothetical protein
MRGVVVREGANVKRPSNYQQKGIIISSEAFFLISKNGSCYFSLIPRRDKGESVRRGKERKEKSDARQRDEEKRQQARRRREVQESREGKLEAVIIVIIRV